jgi:hypothetical protein
MRVLVACEFSGIVRDAFKAKGHDAWSCDLLPTEKPGQHIVNDVRNVLDWDWDLMIAHPPCTYTSDAGNRWFKVQPDRYRLREEGLKFFIQIMNADIPYIALENPAPRNYICRQYRMPDIIIEPYHFGHPLTKSTGLWLKNLPPLMATMICTDPFVNWSKKGSHAHNGKSRSRTFPGIANAMAQQWSSL